MKTALALVCLIAVIAFGTHLATLRPPRCDQCGAAHPNVPTSKAPSR